MRATATIQMPTGVKMVGKSAPYFERGDGAKGVARVEIVNVRDVDTRSIEVTFDIDVTLEVTLRNDRGQLNPNLCVGFGEPYPAIEKPA